MKKTLFIIDAYNLIYRMFYAIPEMHTRAGEQVNAIFGVAKFLKALSDENPTAEIVVTTDVGQSFRSELFGEYKGTRDRMPDNLRSQIDGVFGLFESAGIPILSREGYEADDIIGSLASKCSEDIQIVIISSDKDLCQFVSDGCVHIYDAMKRKFMKRSDVIEKFGVPPEQVRDYLAIVGDSSDNIPGIAGFGPKKAVDLLSQYETLDGIYIHITDLAQKTQDVLSTQKDRAYVSRELATIITDLDVPLTGVSLSGIVTAPSYQEQLLKYEFRSLLPRDMTPEVKKISTETKTIETLDQLQKLIQRIQEKKTVSIICDDKIIVGVDSANYQIQQKHIDTTDLIRVLLSPEVQLVGYDLKAALKRFYSIQKPLQAKAEGQGSLF